MSWLWEVPPHYPLPPGASFVTLPSETTRETASGNHSHYSLSYNTWHGLRLSPFCCLAGSVLIKNPCDLFILLICLCTSSSRWQFRVSGKTPLLSLLLPLPCSLTCCIIIKTHDQRQRQRRRQRRHGSSWRTDEGPDPEVVAKVTRKSSCHLVRDSWS